MSKELLVARKTRSNTIPEINMLYAYDTKHKAKFTHRHQRGIGYRYMNHNVLERAGEDEIHIYHRTAVIRGVTKGLTMVTKQGKFREVQRWFNEQIREIESNDKLFDIFSHAKSKPVQLGLRYDY